MFVQGFNDTHGHAEVLELLDKALAEGEGEGTGRAAGAALRCAAAGARSAAVLVRVPVGRALAAPVRQRSGRPSIPARSRISCHHYAAELRSKKA